MCLIADRYTDTQQRMGLPYLKTSTVRARDVTTIVRHVSEFMHELLEDVDDHDRAVAAIDLLGAKCREGVLAWQAAFDAQRHSARMPD